MKGDVRRNLRQVLDSLPSQVKLVAVSKYHPAESILEAYEEGQRAFGESHVQELQAKHKELPEDIEWHFIGHQQTNKVKYVVPYVAMIDAVDSMRLLREINRQAEKQDKHHNREHGCERLMQLVEELGFQNHPVIHSFSGLIGVLQSAKKGTGPGSSSAPCIPAIV